MVAHAQAQLAFETIDLTRWTVLARILPPAPAARATPEQLPLIWMPPAPRIEVPRAPVVALRRERGGPDLSRPCEGCPIRARCKTGCELLDSALGMKEEIVDSNLISSPALMEGRGYDEAFYVLHEALKDPDDEVEHWPEFVAHVLPLLRPWVETLPRAQQEIMHQLMEGRTRAEVTHAKGISRQSIHKTYWRARRALVAQVEEYLARNPVTLARG